MDEDDNRGFDLGGLKTREDTVRTEFWAKLRGVLGRINFAREAVAAWYCATDPATPMRVKAILIGALAYFIMPVDVIPDFILGLGYTDDAAIFWAAWKAVGAHIQDRHRARAAAALAGETLQPPDGGAP